jgi:hypothetical protein
MEDHKDDRSDDERHREDQSRLLAHLGPEFRPVNPMYENAALIRWLCHHALAQTPVDGILHRFRS